MQNEYDPKTVEAKWQKMWEKEEIFKTDLEKAKKPFYTHVMWPYPSGDKLHVGHWYNFGPADSHARFMRMQGYDVFSPMGFDAFGLPAENYAIKTGVPPAKSTEKNVKTMIKQLKRMGCMYDWSRMANSSEPEYYKWTQWLFLKMYENKLAYKKEGNVNYCPSCQTVLANEQVWEGKCERCGTEVVQKKLEQWFWKTTKYADEMLDGLNDLDWPEKTKLMQKNWIDRSEGANLFMKVKGSKRGVVGPINWPFDNHKLAADLNRQLTNELAGDFNRRLTDEWKSRIHSRLRTVHLVFTPHGRGLPFEDKTMAEGILRILEEVALRHNIILHEAAAMPDHVHILASFEESRHLEMDIVKKLKGASAREFLQRFDFEDAHLWGQKKHYEDVNTVEQFEKIFEYIRNNPMKSGISSACRLLSELPISFEVYDSIPQTFKAQTFVIIAPEHPLAPELVKGTKNEKEVLAFVEKIRRKKAAKRFNFEEDIEGVDTGRVVDNPFGMGDLPIWIASFVVMEYGTGIVSCSAHDERDFAFAKKYDIPLRSVMFPADPQKAEKVKKLEYCYTKDPEGVLQYPEEFRGRKWGEVREDIIDFIVKKGYGRRQVNYRLRDWLVSRQRYWGAPIPIVYDPEGKAHPIPEKHLPWLLPTDVEFKPTGRSPLYLSREFRARTEKIFGKGWVPEFDTMDTFVCSSYYSLMYLGASNEKGIYRQRDLKEQTPCDPKLEKKWMPVQMYIGGPEHATMHLIYARFVTMALKDFGIVSKKEPFKKLVHQGLITNKGAKMSKSKENVVSPDIFVEKYGSDVFRMYLMFMGPFVGGGDWSDTGIKGVVRFVQRLWKVMTMSVSKKIDQDKPHVVAALHKTIKKVTADIEALHFNTAISALMELLNLLEKEESFSVETGKTFALLIGPLAPHFSDELWSTLGGPSSAKATEGKKGFSIQQPWPKYDPKLIIENSMTIVVQVNGKVRGDLVVDTDATKEAIIASAKALPNVRKFLAGAVKKEIYVPGRLVSLVI